MIKMPGEQGWQEGLSMQERHKKLLLNDHMSDVTFYVGFIENTEEQKSISLDRLRRVPAHKFILAASSSVFDAMFFGLLAAEVDQKAIKVLDVEPEAFIAMLR